MKKALYILAFIFIFSSCEDFATNERIFGNYSLVAVDVEENLCLCYFDSNDKSGCSTIIEATVFAIGYNDKFMIAKQHPHNERQITNYFILPIKSGMNFKENSELIGPLTIKEFNQKRKDYKISNSLQFTIEKERLK